jgi:hypothetical protein
MKWTTRIYLSPAAYFIMMAGAAVICLYNAVIQLVLTGFGYHVLIQVFLALNAVYILHKKRKSGEGGFDIELFFIIMAGIVVLAFSALGLGSWFYFQGTGYRLRQEYVGLIVLVSIYVAAMGWQVLVSLVKSKRGTRRSEEFRIRKT